MTVKATSPTHLIQLNFRPNPIQIKTGTNTIVNSSLRLLQKDLTDLSVIGHLIVGTRIPKDKLSPQSRGKSDFHGGHRVRLARAAHTAY
ncbi:hypothetical protein N7517_000203 [Penicillium concentricum]|uniref:Uncharacterized protein n=1 Tax=Penicillium concentricum TaxID=293559 RepID=A0A9W9SPV3_9EURO|nr:uncharacterized protein N7517_000203 [Penicillium concentricum]KAJ5382292.1 hypothetical protein N7517_000203 [Penicillium concentricum]